MNRYVAMVVAMLVDSLFLMYLLGLDLWVLSVSVILGALISALMLIFSLARQPVEESQTSTRPAQSVEERDETTGIWHSVTARAARVRWKDGATWS